MEAIYQPISIACVLPDIFPQVALFTEARGKHVLYKDETRPFTEADRVRLLSNKTCTMYVRSGDFEAVSNFAEEHLAEILDRDDVDQEAKNQALVHTSENYLKDIFSDPEKSQDAERCKKLTGHLAKYISETHSVSKLFQTLGGSSTFAIKHSMQVASLSMLAWSKLFPERPDDLVDIGVAGMLHDIGMSLILSTAADDQDYWTIPSADEIRRHPFEGYIFLRRNGQYNDLILDAVRHHHERFFGGGYPGGLKGDEISLPTQVIGLADMYCTLITDRPTRKASTQEEAFKIIGDDSHKCFSTLLFTAFQMVIKE